LLVFVDSFYWLSLSPYLVLLFNRSSPHRLLVCSKGNLDFSISLYKLLL
jgi:hypothetical protein